MTFRQFFFLQVLKKKKINLRNRNIIAMKSDKQAMNDYDDDHDQFIHANRLM